MTELDPLVPNVRYLDSKRGHLKVVNRFLGASPEFALQRRIGIWQPTREGLQPVPEESLAFEVLGASSAQRQLIVRKPGEGGTAVLRFDADRVTPTRRIAASGARSAALSDDGRRLAIGRNNGTDEAIELWGWESDDLPARKLSEVKSSPEHVLQLSFAEAGHTLVGRLGDGRIQIWDVKDAQLTPRTTLSPYLFYGLAVALDGHTLATVGGGSGVLELWNLKSDLTNPITNFVVPGTNAVAFSPDGRRVAASFWENGVSAGVQIINLASGTVERRLTFPGRVQELAFTDDNRHLITGNANATIYVVRLK